MERQIQKRRIVCCLSIIFLLLAGDYLLNTIDSYPRIVFEIENAKKGDCFSVFYLTPNMVDFDESHKINQTIISKSQKCNFIIRDKNLNKDKLRIDFGTGVGNIRISSVKMKSLFAEKEISPQFMASCDFSADVGKISIEGNMLSMERRGNDSYVILDKIDEVQKNFYWNRASLLIACCLGLTIIYVIYLKKGTNILSISKKDAIIVSSVLFFAYRIRFFATHIGFFATDEFFHISTLNPDYITDYNRAVYINFIIKIICKIFGQSDLTVKLVPFILGAISFACCLYLCYQLYDNPYWIITICEIITYMPYVAFNHFYIRMYVFLEAMIMLNCVLLYNAQQKLGTKSEKVNLIISGVITGFYSLYTKDFSGKAIIMLWLIAVLYHFWRSRLSSLCDKRLLLKMGGGLLCVGSIVGVLVIKLQGLEVLEKMFSGDYEYRTDKPVFLKFVFVTIFYITIPFIISLIYTCKRKTNGNFLYIIAALPLLGYIVIFYNAYMIRNYVAFIPILCIMAYLAYDKFRLPTVIHLLIILCVLGLTRHIQPNFWQEPTIPRETAFENVGTAVSRAKDLERLGYELVALMPAEIYLAYFDLMDNVCLDINAEGFADELRPVFESDRKTVIVANVHGLACLNRTDWGMWDKNKYIVENYDGGSCVIILN